MVGDFVQMNKNPEFRSKTELSTIPGTSAAKQLRSGGRRQSLNITVGTAGPPPPETVRGRRQRTRSECPVPDLSQLEQLSAKVPSEYSNDAKNENNTLAVAPRRHSAPMGISASQRIKLERIFSHIEETDEEDYDSDENEFCQSVSRIQISDSPGNGAPKIKDASNVDARRQSVVTQKCG
uniref:Uncharacterized protein n=1 Tax=Acrobeloides nanus TaxID=290746 RepID=A0A914DZM1_9BILA